MADELPSVLRRTGSFPFQDRPESRLRHRNDSLQRFAENVRHIRPQDRGHVQFVDEPEVLDPYEATASYPYGYSPSAEAPPGARVREDYRGWVHNANGPPMPLNTTPYSRFQVPPPLGVYTGPLSNRRPSRRSTVDSYVSDYGQSDISRRNGRGRVRFIEPDRPSRSHSRPSPPPPPPPPPPLNDRTGYGYSSDSEDVNDAYSNTITASYRSRSRSRSRLKAQGVYQDSYVSDLDEEDDEEGFDELLGGKVFQFVPSRASKGLSKSGYSIDTDISVEKSEAGVSNVNDDLNIPRASGILHVFKSQYTGDAVSDGTHNAKLTVVHDPKRQRQPLFRWMHLEQRMMNLDELSTEISRIPAITDSERNGFAKLLAEIKRSSVKVRPTSKGNNVRHMDPKPVRVTIPPDGRKSQTSRSLTWLCVPYFSLEKYSGLLSASMASSFPIETLLQSEYARTTQERDMQQAVCQNGEAPEGCCFHIAQLWCIVLDNSLLITCSRMPATSLRGDLVRIVTEPSKEPSGKGKTLYVSYYDSVLWALPLEACSNWFDFIMHFREFWPQAVKVYHRGNVVTDIDWPRIVNMVRNVNTKITLDLRLWYHPHPPPIGVLRPIGEEVEDTRSQNAKTPKPGSRNPKSNLKKTVDNNFHVFSWLYMTENEPDGAALDHEMITTQLQEAEEYLLSSTTIRDRNAYHNCNSSSRRFVYTYLKDKGQKIDNSEEETQERREYENKVDLYNAADITFSFFLPQLSSKDTPTVGKFWGAIQNLVEMPNSDGDDDVRPQRAKQTRRRASANHNVYPLRSTLRGLTRVIQSFQDIVSHTPSNIRTTIEVPDSLVRAWLHLVMALIQASLNDEAWNENILVAEALIRRGMNDIMDDLPAEDLLPSSILQPMELVALLSLRLLQDSTGTYSGIDNTYSDYLKGLENEITTNNSDRSHQFRIALFKQEIAVIRRVITSQLKMIDGMSYPQRPTWADQTRREREMLEREREKSKAENTRMRSHEKQGTAYVDRLDNMYEGHNSRGLPGPHFIPVRDPDAFSKLASTDPGGFRELLGRECRSLLERRDSEFLELDVEASRLEDMNANKIEVTKDRQEAAVYAFTMVTIIFLPLSTISSIFGMNASDVRDMDLGQWAYWAVAVPTTVAVIMIGLWWMGELHNIVNWVRGLPSRRNRGYARLPHPAANGVIYYPQGDYPMDLQTIRPHSRATLGPPVPPRGSWRY